MERRSRAVALAAAAVVGEILLAAACQAAPLSPAPFDLMAGKRQHKPVVIHKEVDEATPQIYNTIVNNENIGAINGAALNKGKARPTAAAQPKPKNPHKRAGEGKIIYPVTNVNTTKLNIGSGTTGAGSGK